MATLKQLPVSPRTKVYRAVVAILQHDPVLSNVIKPENFRCWAGSSKDNMVFEFSNSPSLRVTPTNGPEEWIFPTAFRGWLYLQCEMLLAGTDVDDVFNLWFAIERALYPDDYASQQAMVAKLQQAGAYTGLPEFSQPAFDAQPADKFFAATGQIKIEVLLQLTG